MNDLINEQINLIFEDLTLISNPYERCMVRTNLIKALTDLSLTAIDEPTGKDSINSNFAKTYDEQTSSNDINVSNTDNTIVQENIESIEEQQVQDTVDNNEILEERLEPKEIDIDNSVSETTPIITIIEDEDGNEFELDITEAYNKLNPELSEEEKIEIAKNITAYNLMPIYDELKFLEDKENKMLLAYYLN